MTRDGGWVSASDLADYAYCPRAHWYQQHPPPDGPAPGSPARSAAGRRYHAEALGAERRRDARGAAYWLALLVGVGLVLGGIAWIFRP